MSKILLIERKQNLILTPSIGSDRFSTGQAVFLVAGNHNKIKI